MWWLLCGLFLLPPASAQETESTYVEVRLVQIEVRAEDSEGKPITGLERGHFSLKDEGVGQEIRSVRFIGGAVNEPGGSSVPENVATTETASVKPTAPPPDPTWIYIATEFGDGREFGRAYPAIRSFIEENLDPGFRVSLAGLPFTDDREALLDILFRMFQGPYGGDGVPSGIDPSLARMSDLELERRLAEDLQEQQGGIASLPGFGFEPMNSGRLDEVAFYSVGRLDRQFPLFGQLALLRYRDLIEKLSLLSGKKMIVLFRQGLPLDRNTARLMNQVTSLALRHRVSFYAIDPKGLETGIDIDSPKAALPWAHALGRRGRRAIVGDQLRSIEYRAGLAALAEETGGRAVDNVNDMGVILDLVTEEATNYYILEYYPKNPGNEGKFHKVDVAVSIPGARIRAVEGYFEPDLSKKLSEEEKSLALVRGLLGQAPENFPLSANLEIFADDDFRPILFSSFGANPLSIVPEPKEDENLDLALTGLVRMSPLALTRLPIYEESRSDYSLPPSSWQTARQDETARVVVNVSHELSPGPYRWQVALQDRKSGKLGTLQKNLFIPDFTKASIPSTLLLTRRVEEVGKSQAIEESDSSLFAGNLRYIPEPGSEFRQGDVIYILYHLYNPTEAECEEAGRGMQMGLLRNSEPVAEVQAGGEAFVSPDQKIIRLTAFIQTQNLSPGEYTFLGVLPGFQSREIGHLEETFTLLPAE